MTNLDEARALLAGITPGPWHVASDAPTYAIYADGGTRVVQTPNQNNYRKFERSEHWLGIESAADAAFIARAPALVASLMADVERLTADAAQLREALNRVRISAVRSAASRTSLDRIADMSRAALESTP